MKVTDIEIPLPKERGFWYRVFEIVPAFLSWCVLAAPFALAFISPLIAAYAIIIYLIAWFLRTLAMTARSVQSYRIMQQHQVLDWQQLIADLDNPTAADERLLNHEGKYPLPWHLHNVERLKASHAQRYKSDDIYHAVIMPFHREGREIIQPSLEALMNSSYDPKRIIVVLSAEERAGKASGDLARQLQKEYKKHFAHLIATVHPADLPGEIKGKGPNANWGCEQLRLYLDAQKLTYDQVVVTTLDCDHRAHHNYFAALSYFYLACPDPVHTTFQPISMFTNNIWDVPAPMRVIATGNSFWNMIVSTRPHMLRNFASHAQSMQAMVDTEYYSKRTVVEDGHQFWRTYFRYDGNHEAFPIFTPIYQDAVLAGGLWKTVREQFKQLSRWAYGASEVAYIAHTGYFKKNKISKVDITFKMLRVLEGHVSWATASLLLLFASLVPIYANPHAKETLVANQLPVISSYIQRLAMLGLIVTLFLSIKLLPPKPEKYSRLKYIPMGLQWLLMPITSILFSSFAALYSQTRLALRRYMDVFDATIKVTKK